MPHNKLGKSVVGYYDDTIYTRTQSIVQKLVQETLHADFKGLLEKKFNSNSFNLDYNY